MIIAHLLLSYWDWAGSNVGAMPACGLVALGAGYLFRKPLGRLAARVHGKLLEPVREHLRVIEAHAEKAHRIAADTHKALTGADHPDAPEVKP